LNGRLRGGARTKAETQKQAKKAQKAASAQGACAAPKKWPLKKRPAAEVVDLDVDPEPPGAKKPRFQKPVPAATPDGALQDDFYQAVETSYATREIALQELGVGRRCRGHAARVVKTSAQKAFTFLQCRLCASTPPCKWRALLRTHADGITDLKLHQTRYREHCAASDVQGKYGYDSLEELREIAAVFSGHAHRTPRAALRQLTLKHDTDLPDEPVEADEEPSEEPSRKKLRQCQNVKKGLFRKRWCSQRWGQLHAKIGLHKELPSNVHKPFFVVAELGRFPSGCPKLTLVASTRNLMKRWGNSAAQRAHCDGGHKFNLLGWPVTLIGVTSQAGHWGLCGLGLSSTMGAAHVGEMLTKWHQSVEKLVGRECRKMYSMTDAETAYARGLAEACHSSPLMCWFHVKKACKDYLAKRFRGTATEHTALWADVSTDLDWAHDAWHEIDFQGRCETITMKWTQSGIADATAWKDPSGGTHTFVSYFQGQWQKQCATWYFGASDFAGPTTNNACERAVRVARSDAGGVVGSVGATLEFMLAQASFESHLGFQADIEREPSRDQWLKACEFQKLLRTDKAR
jgi:hypothetical protein